MNKVTLYKNAKHGISRWIIWHEGPIIKWSTEAKIGDSKQIFFESIDRGLAGRSLQQQIDLRMKARIRSKKDDGYVDSFEKAKDPLLKNTMGFYKPMLAQKIQDIKKFDLNDYFIQPKLDGHRCMVKREGSEIIAYSRQGRQITTIDHILKEIDIPDGVTLDGELYVHGQPLQTIASWAKRLQPDSKQLQFVIYDVVEPDMKYEDRLEMLFDELSLPSRPDHPYFALATEDAIGLDITLKQKFTRVRAQGYEGLILRDRNTSYEVGRRSKGLIKVKETHDDDFKVVGVTASKWGWGILHCKLGAATFKTPAPGTLHEKTEVLRNLEDYIGQWVTVEYAHLTKDGVPFHPVATRWVTKI